MRLTQPHCTAPHDYSPDRNALRKRVTVRGSKMLLHLLTRIFKERTNEY